MRSRRKKRAAGGASLHPVRSRACRQARAGWPGMKGGDRRAQFAGFEPDRENDQRSAPRPIAALCARRPGRGSDCDRRDDGHGVIHGTCCDRNGEHRNGEHRNGERCGRHSRCGRCGLGGVGLGGVGLGGFGLGGFACSIERQDIGSGIVVGVTIGIITGRRRRRTALGAVPAFRRIRGRTLSHRNRLVLRALSEGRAERPRPCCRQARCPLLPAGAVSLDAQPRGSLHTQPALSDKCMHQGRW